MYHVVMGVSREDDHLVDKVETVTGLPAASDAIRVTLVHIQESGDAIESIPEVAKARELLAEAGVEVAIHDPDDAHPAGSLIDTASALDADLLCIGGRHRSAAGKLQLKQGAQRILLRATCPVVIAGDVDSRKPRT